MANLKLLYKFLFNAYVTQSTDFTVSVAVVVVVIIIIINVVNVHYTTYPTFLKPVFKM
jgi:hypothetical protein